MTADGSGGGLPGQSLPARDSLPSPHLLHVQGAASRLPAASASSLSLNSVTSEEGSSSNNNSSSRMRRRRKGSGSGRGSEEESLSSSSSPERVVSPAGDKGVVEFQQYLHDHGLNLDMSSVQTSDL